MLTGDCDIRMIRGSSYPSMVRNIRSAASFFETNDIHRNSNNFRIKTRSLLHVNGSFSVRGEKDARTLLPARPSTAGLAVTNLGGRVQAVGALKLNAS